MGLFDWIRGGGTNPLASSSSAANPTAPGSGASPDFRMEVEDVFTITGSGTVVTGTIAAGTIDQGASIVAERLDGSRLPLTIVGIEMHRKQPKSARAGDMVGLLTRGRSARELTRGDVLRAG